MKVMLNELVELVAKDLSGNITFAAKSERMFVIRFNSAFQEIDMFLWVDRDSLKVQMNIAGQSSPLHSMLFSLEDPADQIVSTTRTATHLIKRALDAYYN